MKAIVPLNGQHVEVPSGRHRAAGQVGRTSGESPSGGASLRELIDRMGHVSRAALIYLRGSDGRQRKIASNLDVLALTCGSQVRGESQADEFAYCSAASWCCPSFS